MAEQVMLTKIYPKQASLDSVSQFRQEFLNDQTLLRLQPALVQRFLESQSISLAEAVIQGLQQLSFSLPDRIVLPGGSSDSLPLPIPTDMRNQAIGGIVDRLIRIDMRSALRSRLMELEQSNNPAVSASAILLRFAMVRHMVHNMLPAGRTVRYTANDGDEIPSIPVRNVRGKNSAITAPSDARTVVEDHAETMRGELQVPYVEDARNFYLPQWVCFDDDGTLLTSTLSEAEANIISMQRYLSVLHSAVWLAPYLVADEEYQFKRYGILGQLVNQGRALAHYQVKEIIHTIQRRASAHDLDRGLSLSLPYFNDQTLKVENFDFDVIPSGRVMFVPAFVVLAVRAQGAKVAQDTRLSPSTRKQILMELATLEQTFLR